MTALAMTKNETKEIPVVSTMVRSRRGICHRLRGCFTSCSIPQKSRYYKLPAHYSISRGSPIVRARNQDLGPLAVSVLWRWSSGRAAYKRSASADKRCSSLDAACHTSRAASGSTLPGRRILTTLRRIMQVVPTNNGASVPSCKKERTNR